MSVFFKTKSSLKFVLFKWFKYFKSRSATFVEMYLDADPDYRNKKHNQNFTHKNNFRTSLFVN